MKRKKLLYIVFGSLIVIILAGIIANAVIKSTVEKRLSQTLKQFSPVIAVTYSKVDISLFQASIRLDSLLIYYNPELNVQHQHKIFIPVISISGIRFFKLVFNKNFSASELNLSGVKVYLDKYLLNKNDSLPSKTFTAINIPFKNISFQSIQLLNADVFEQTKKNNTRLFNGSFFINNVSLQHPDSSFLQKDIHFASFSSELHDIKYAVSDYNSMLIKSVIINSKDSTLKIDSLRIVPLLNKFKLGEVLGHQADHVSAVITKITISGFDALKLLGKEFVAQEVSINNSVVYVFRDRRLPRLLNKQPTALEYLKQIPFNVFIRHFQLSNATVTYEEFPKGGSQSGILKIAHININMSPFFNKPISNNSTLRSYVKASIMNAGAIHAVIDLSLTTGVQQIKGAIDNLNVTALNSSAENLGRFHIQSGLLDNLSFQFMATDEQALGEIVGVYHNLVIDKLKKDDKHGKKVAGFPSFILHHFIIPKNKDASLPVSKRTGKINYDRDPTRLITFYYMKALLSGIRDSFTLGFLLPK